MPTDTQTASTPNRPKSYGRSTDKWKWAYYALAFLNLATICAAFFFGSFLNNEYKKTIETDNFWSTSTDQMISLNDAIVASNAPGNNIFDSRDPVLERYFKHKADIQFRERLETLRTHLSEASQNTETATNLLDEINNIEASFRILDAYSQAIFDSMATGQVDVAGSIMASMDRTAAECSIQLSKLTHEVSRIQKQNFQSEVQRSEKLTEIEFILLLLFALIVIVTLIFGRRMFVFLKAQSAEAEASRIRADRARHELKSQTFALDQHSIVAITSTSGRIQYVNDKFCDISKYSREELIGKDHRILNSGHHPRSFFANMYKTIANGGVWRAEVKNKAKDGTHYWVDTNIVPYRNEQGRLESYVAIRTDITERIKAQEDLAIALEGAKQASEDAEAANKAKSEFLATMSHEIRTPMNSVIGFSNLLLDSKLPEDAKNFARYILNSGQSLLAIINDILDFSKIEAGKLEVESMPFDLRQIAEEAAELLSNEASDKGLEMLLRYDPDLPLGFHADPGRIRQIIINLAGNAIKFTDSGHVFIEVTREPEQPDNFARISVSDTGIGIPEDAHASLFTKFTQADSSTSRKFGGTGLGLAICKLLAEMMGGEIHLKSKEGQGSTFWFTLPIPPTPIELKTEKTDLDISNTRILIADDYPLNRTLLAEQCGQWNLTADTAADGADALQKLKDAVREGRPYQVALIDYCMPTMDGPQFAKRVREDQEIQTTKLILITSGSFHNGQSHFLASGFDAFFLKPIIKPEQLRLAIAKTLGYDCSNLSEKSNLIDKPEPAPPGGRFRILLVDDTALNQTLLRSMLEKKYGYSVDTAGNGKEAVKQYLSFNYDAIFMDCMMPIMDGFEATKAIRKYERDGDRPHVPIIALTANAFLGDQQKCIESGMDDYLSKPIAQDALVASLQRWLGKRISPDTTEVLPLPDNAEPPPESQYFNLDRLVSLLTDDMELISEILTVFVGNLDSFAEKAKTHQNLEELRLVSHTIKGSAAECGADKLSALAKQLEKACIENDSESIAPLLDVLSSSIALTQESVLSTLDSIRPQDAS
ncbi:response regulator [Pelagicoccus sp. SDUM812002]|uniref:hybrid sensor histidine kinase/response regulator n=1 Tax=Pelagicoccus sp. SDUM812002 TaxID=3041266 RepID=UPI00280F44AE|nr:response regulator [Pelagicoccus sp. SDUM812002]MDQ8186323.1 response regulator [Pelagicoccus sp. SDUM812002]